MSDQTQGKEYHEVRTPTIPKSKMLLYRKKKNSKRAEQATKFLYDKSFCKSTM